MPTIITKYSDYSLFSIEYFIGKITAELVYRDLKGLTNDKIEIINVTKQHPLIALMAAQLRAGGGDPLRSGLLPAIAVTPGNSSDDGETLGVGLEQGVVDDTFIDNLNVYLAKTDEEREVFGLLTTDQINDIKDAYEAAETGEILYQIHQWRKKEEINISSWTDSPDLDILISNLLDSMLAEIAVSFTGDDSAIINLHYNAVKGLTNFNYGRVLFGTEYNLTFLNTFNNYTIYTESRISDHETNFTFTTPGEE